MTSNQNTLFCIQSDVRDQNRHIWALLEYFWNWKQVRHLIDRWFSRGPNHQHFKGFILNFFFLHLNFSSRILYFLLVYYTCICILHSVFSFYNILKQQVQLSWGDYHLTGNLVRNERVRRPTWWSKPVHQNDQKLRGDLGADSDTCEVDDIYSDDNEEASSNTSVIDQFYYKNWSNIRFHGMLSYLFSS